MKRLLILGASVLQLPAILRAKEMGLCTAVADYDPHAVGIPYADRWYNVSTIDEQGVYEAAKDFGADGIMTLATDMPMRSLAYACEKLGFPGISYDTAVRATDKGEMIRAFEAHGVPHPWYHVLPDREAFDAAVEKILCPCIMKPTDNAGSRGVVLCRSVEELKSSYAYSRRESRCGAVIVEEYLRGPEFSVEVMVTDGEPQILRITDKLTTGAPHFVEMGHSQPTAQPEKIREEIACLAIRACRAVGIRFGPAHVEMILTQDGLRMVELGARMGGDCITTHLVPLSTGIDMVGSTIKMALGEAPDLRQRFSMGSAIRYFRVPCGVLRSITGTEEAKKLPGVREISFVRQAGETVGEIGSSTDRIGFVIAQGDSAEAAIRSCEAAMEKVRIEIS